jgi:hypothetical protein
VEASGMEGGSHLVDVKQLCLKFLTQFVMSNKVNQAFLFDRIDEILLQMRTGFEEARDLVIAIFKDNFMLSSVVPQEVLSEFAASQEDKREIRVLHFFKSLISTEGRSIEKNQTKVLYYTHCTLYSLYTILTVHSTHALYRCCGCSRWLSRMCSRSSRQA